MSSRGKIILKAGFTYEIILLVNPEQAFRVQYREEIHQDAYMPCGNIKEIHRIPICHAAILRKH